ncbi:MAG: MarR family transcriptional regulator [Coriobacteriaceae bacterium]|jgi:DNA-binding MarR family transcriptional regulator|nr:MarR family transcriptional regulator [Coriobacteriaceae bacterium]
MKISSNINSAIFAYQTSCIRIIENVALQNGHVSFRQIRLIAYLYSAKTPQRVSDIAKSTEQHASNVSNVSNELVLHGYVQRVASRDDRRIVSLTLTDEGTAFFENIAHSVLKALADFHLYALNKAISVYGTTVETYATEFQQLINMSPIRLSENIETFSLREKRLKQALAGRVSVNAYYLLLTLATTSGPLSAGYLANYLYMDKTVVSTCISELSNKGLLTTLRSPADRRTIELGISPKGTEFIEGTLGIIDELFDTGRKYSEGVRGLLFRLAACICEPPT